MTTIRSYTNNFEVIDYTQELVTIPNQWGLINQLGIFNNIDGVSQHTIAIEEINKTLGLITDRVRGERAQVSKDQTRKLHTYAIPHFPVDEAISPKDMQGKRAFGSEGVETLDAVRFRKMQRLRWMHAATLEFARAQAITAGTIYAPNGTVAGNYYTDFNITRKEVNFALGTSGTEVLAKIEEVIAHIQDNALSGEIASEIIGLCSPEFFAALIIHPNVKAAYQYYASSQEPLRNRLDGGNLAGPRKFVFGGVTFIEYRGSYNSTVLIPANEAYFLPRGTMDTFFTYFSPADKFDLVNTSGQEVYMFEYRDPKGSLIEIETESNFLNLIRRPAVIVKAVKA